MTATGMKATHGRQVERVLWIVLLLNMAVAAAKFFYGLASGSASMQADGIHSVFDSLGNVIGLIGISLAARPADAGHPYGHSKFETYGSLAIGEVEELIGFEPEEAAECETAGGLLLSLFDRIPDTGDTVVLENRGVKVTFRVVDMDRLRIDKISVAIEKPGDADAD